MPHSTNEQRAEGGACIPRKLVLCFDGTGNVFNGNTSDTNIVKLYDKLDRKDPSQYHYYQTGIGTYHTDGSSINKGFFGNIKSNISKSIDSGFATTFDNHVMAGYRFIMRYYKEGDKIYIFGFSRGAFTARFLARMVYRVGLLSEGNEEMIPFAYDLYHQYVKGMIDEPKQEAKASSHATGSETDPLLRHEACGDECPEPDEQQINKNKLNAFKTTFCRSEGNGDSGIKVHFLGMFDCVSSVSVLDSPFGVAPKAVSILGTAHHVRHAVAVDEHRVKFKAALLHQDNNHPLNKEEDIKEVWFPGNHGDVGGGWPAPPPMPPSTGPTVQYQRSWWRRIFTSLKEDKPSNSGTDPYQMSDVPLAWMIRELELIGEKDPASALKWGPRKDGFKRHFFKKIEQAYCSPMHDTLKISGGSSLFKVLLWNLMEWLPIRRWELIKNKGGQGYQWGYITWPFNRGASRDIPEGALLHDSLLKRLTSFKYPEYRPSNNRGDDSAPCLIPEKFTLVQEDVGTERSAGEIVEPRGIHNIYTLEGEGSARGKNGGIRRGKPF